MAHIRTTIITTPDAYKELLDTMQNRKYEIESDNLKSYCRAQVAEVHNLDIRIAKQAVPQFIADLNAIDFHTSPFKLNHKHHIPHYWLVRPVMWVLRKLTGHYLPEISSDNQAKSKRFITKGWAYAFLWGAYKDPETVKGNEEL